MVDNYINTIISLINLGRVLKNNRINKIPVLRFGYYYFNVFFI